jgi:hypothetical protein
VQSKRITPNFEPRCQHRSPVERLPRNANGKVMKKQLREAWAAAQ